jgi:hypothetical protein
MNLDEDDSQQQVEEQQNTAINEDDDSDDPAEANDAEQVDMESSPAKEAAARKVKVVYKSKRLRAQEEKRADEHKKKLEEAAAEKRLREIEREYDDPPRAAEGGSKRAAPTAKSKPRTEAQKPSNTPKRQNASTPGRTTPGAKRSRKTQVPTITPSAAEVGMVPQAGSAQRAPQATSRHGGARRVSFNQHPVSSIHDASREMQSSTRSVSSELQTNLDAPPTPFQHRLVSPGGGGATSTLSPPLELFKEDFDAETGVYVVSQEKLKAFLENRASSVATSRAAEAIANLTASGDGPEQDRLLDDQDPHFEGKPVFS